MIRDRRLRLPRPATLRVRLTLLAGVVTFVFLTAAAFAVATEARISLLDSARQHFPRPSTEDDDDFSPGFALEIPVPPSGAVVPVAANPVYSGYDTDTVPRCTPRILRSGASVPQPNALCLAMGQFHKVSANVSWAKLPGNSSEGSLKLLPWTDPAHGPEPIRRQVTLGLDPGSWTPERLDLESRRTDVPWS